MPTVRRPERTVGVDPLRGGMKQAAPTALSEGAGVDQARAEKWGAVGRFGDTLNRTALIGVDTILKIREEEQDTANRTVALSFSNRISDFKVKRLYDGADATMNKMGLDAQGEPEAVLEEYDAMIAEAAGAASNPAQREALARMASQERQQIQLEVVRHATTQAKQHAAGELKARLENGVDAAIRARPDPRQVAVELANLEGALMGMGPKLGMGEEAIKAELSRLREGTAVGVVRGHLADAAVTKNFDKAKTAYAAMSDMVTDPKVREAIEADLAEGSARDQAYAAFDKIKAEGGTLTQKMDKAASLPSREREIVEQMVTREDGIQKGIERDTAATRMKGVWDILAQTRGDMTAIPPDVLREMDWNERNAAQGEATRRAKGDPPEYNVGVLLDQYQLMRDDPAKFAAANLHLLKGKISDGNLEQLAGAQVSIRNGERNATVPKDPQAQSLLTTDQMLRHTVGPSWDPKKNPAHEALLHRVAMRVAAASGAAGGAKADDTEIQRVIDDEWQEVVIDKGTWSGALPQGFLWQGIGEDRPFRDVVKPRGAVTPADIPPRDTRTITRMLNAEGVLQPTPQAILERFMLIKERTGQVRRIPAK